MNNISRDQVDGDLWADFPYCHIPYGLHTPPLFFRMKHRMTHTSAMCHPYQLIGSWVVVKNITNDGQDMIITWANNILQFQTTHQYESIVGKIYNHLHLKTAGVLTSGHWKARNFMLTYITVLYHWHLSCVLKPFRWKHRNIQEKLVITMAADGLAPDVTRSSATVVLTM